MPDLANLTDVPDSVLQDSDVLASIVRPGSPPQLFDVTFARLAAYLASKSVGYAQLPAAVQHII